MQWCGHSNVMDMSSRSSLGRLSRRRTFARGADMSPVGAEAAGLATQQAQEKTTIERKSALQRVLAEAVSKAARDVGLSHQAHASLESGRSFAERDRDAIGSPAEAVQQVLTCGLQLPLAAARLTLRFPVAAASCIGQEAYRKFAPEAVTSTVDWYQAQCARAEAARRAMLEDAQLEGSISDEDQPESEHFHEHVEERRDGEFPKEQVEQVLALCRQNWERKSSLEAEHHGELVSEDAPEFAVWLRPACAVRMLRCARGEVAEAAGMLEKAIKCQISDRALLQQGPSEPQCNLCILGEDLQSRPMVFVSLCTVSPPLASLRDQVVFSVYRAEELCGDDGTLTFVVDMRGFSAKLLTDKDTLAHVAHRMDAIGAGRVEKIILVDWSRLMGAAWFVLKPLLPESVQKRIACVSESSALTLLASQVDAACLEKFKRAFALARDPKVTVQEQIAFARAAAVPGLPFPQTQEPEPEGSSPVPK